MWHVNGYTSTAGGQAQTSARGTSFLWRAPGRRSPVVFCLSGGHRQGSASGEATTGVREGWPPELLLYLLFYIIVFDFLSILLKGLFSYKNVQKMYDLIK